MNSIEKSVPFFHSMRLFFTLSFVLLKAHVADSIQCFPSAPETCRFGGQCTSITTFFFELGNFVEFIPNEYRCRCPTTFNCFEEGGFHPVCGSDGETYFNDLCRRVRECTEQKPINVRCNRMCSACPETPESRPPVQPRCPASESNYCFYFGECLMSESGSKYCRCRRGYFGKRCAFSSPSGRIPSPEVHGTSRRTQR